MLVLTLHHDTVFEFTDETTGEALGTIKRSDTSRHKNIQIRLGFDFPKHIKITRLKEEEKV